MKSFRTKYNADIYSTLEVLKDAELKIYESPYKVGAQFKDIAKGMIPGSSNRLAKGRIMAGRLANNINKEYQIYLGHKGYTKQAQQKIEDLINFFDQHNIDVNEYLKKINLKNYELTDHLTKKQTNKIMLLVSYNLIQKKKVKQINEIQNIDYDKESIPKRQASISRQDKSKKKFIGNIGEIEVYSVAETKHHLSNADIIIYLENQNNPVGKFVLNKVKEGYQTHYSLILPEYQGQNLGYEVYKFFIQKLGLMLISGNEQSLGAQKLWTKLWHTPGIFVCGLYVPMKKKREYFQVEPNDFGELEGKYDIYNIAHHMGYFDDLQMYKRLLDKQIDKKEITSEERREKIKQYRAELKRKDNDYDDRMISDIYLIASSEPKI